MERIERAVSNSGPLIHLTQIKSFNVLGIIKRIYIPQEVFDEVCSFGLPGKKEVRESKLIKVKDLHPQSKDLAKLISERYSLGLGEAASLALAKQENIDLFLTDDLAARIVAKRLRIRPHGTIGIILKAFRLGIVNKETTLKMIKDLHTTSSLFLTSELVRYILKEVEKSH